MSGIYAIINLINGKLYIGQSNNIQKRIRNHLILLRNGNHYNGHLQSAWNKYGEDNFDYVVLKECSVDELDYYEIKYIAEYKTADRACGYNLGAGGHRCSRSEETRKKLSIALKGREIKESTRRKLSQVNSGYKMTEGQLQKIKEKAAGHPGASWNAEQRALQRVNHPNRKAVKQIDLNNGTVLHTYMSMKQAADETGISRWHIFEVCNGLSNHAGGYKWEFADCNGENNRVLQKDFDGNVIQIFESMTEAAKGTGCSVGSISRVCHHIRRSTGGFVWEFENNHNEKNEQKIVS